MQTQKLKDSKTRECRTCKNILPISEFGFRAASKDGLMTECKQCNRDKQKVQYRNNKKYYLDRNREHRASNRERYNELKSNTPCTRCGNFYPNVVMDYDHLDPEDKDHCVSKMMGHSWKAIQREIEKCELLCANCHRIKTYETTNRQKQHTITTSLKRDKR